MRELLKFLISCTVLGLVFSQSYEYDSEEDVPEFSSLEELTECIAEGTCPMEVEQFDVDDSFAREQTIVSDTSMPYIPHEELSYSRICQKVTSKLHQLELQHPELKAMKMELLQKITKYSSAFDSQIKGDGSIIFKIINFVVLVAEKLKAEFLHKLEKKIPYPVPEIIQEHELGYPFVGSLRAIPGEHYPNYTEVPITSFSCSDKKYIPGFYADLDAGCQVFHVCYEHRMENFLCPVGTIFNQPILACDYWYSSNCSQAPLYYDVNVKEEHKVVITKEEEILNDIITTVIDEKPMPKLPKGGLQDLLKFLPIKATITDFSKPQIIPIPKVVKPVVVPKFIPKPFTGPNLALKAKTKGMTYAAKAKIPVVKSALFTLPLAKTTIPVVKGKLSALPLAKTKLAVAATVPVAKVATNAIPLKLAKTKLAAAATVPVAKIAANAIPLKITKTKLAATVPVAKVATNAIPLKIAKTKLAAAATVPVAKVASNAIPLAIAKTKLAGAAATVPMAKLATKAIPLMRMTAMKPKLMMAPAIKLSSASILKAKAAISPMTKKALALGYKKLLKAKKIAMFG